MKKPIVYLRADGNSEIGLGHVYRLLALAEKLNGEFDCVFIIREPSETLRKIILKYCNEIYTLRNYSDYMEEVEFWKAKLLSGNEIVVLDGYNFDTEFQQELINEVGTLICVDDIHSFHFVSDYIINVGGEDLSTKYSAEFYTKFLFGFKYSLLRKEFDATGRKNDENNVLICLGGADPENFTGKILNECLIKRPEFNYHVVLGSAFKREDEFQENKNVHIHKNLPADQLAFLMKNCRYGICSASTISYEFLSTGGYLYLIKTIPNQENIYNYLLSKKVAAAYDDFLSGEILNADLRENQNKFLKIKSEFNYAEFFRQLNDLNKYRFRLANSADCKIYFDWANDAETRAQSFSSELIIWENHVKWFEEKLKSTNTIFLVLQDEKISVGQLRFEIEGDKATINYSIDSSNRGKGFGKLIIEKAVRYLNYMRPEIKIVIGFVKEKNPASQKAFIANRFREEKSCEQECCELKYTLLLNP